MEIREFEIRETVTDQREVYGIAVPYGVVSNGEMFARDAAIPAENTMLFWRHNEPIGKVTEYEQTDEGLMIRAKFTEGVRQADEAYALVKDGVINKFSIGFNLIESNRDDNGINVVTKADVKEISLVPMPWYDSADITEVRESAPIEKEEETMEETVVPDTAGLDEVRQEVEMLQRQIATLEVAPSAPAVDTRTAGEVLQAIASGDETAIRAYTGATTADSVLRDAWIGDLTRIVEEVPGVRQVFSTGGLPAEGNFIEYASLTSNSVAVNEQAAEGDDLTYGEVVIDSHTAAVKTFGGYSELTRQAIERSSIAYLDHVLRLQAVAAGKALNTFVRAEYLAEHALQVTAGNTVTLATTPGYADWLNTAIDAQIKFQAQGLTMDALVVDPATFKSLLNVESTDGRPVFLVTGSGSNNVGSLNVRGLSGDLASIPVIMDAELASDEIAFVNSGALRLYTSAVARLQDENIINLSRSFSVYMFGAVAHEIPAGIVPVVPVV